MKMNGSIKATSVALALVAIFGSSSAFADTADLKVELLDVGNSIGFTVNSISPAQTLSESAGVLTAEGNALSFLAFCTEVLQPLSLSAVTYTTSSRMISSDLQSLYNTGYASLSNSTDQFDRAAGFQIALWEILDDKNLGNGNFSGWTVDTGSDALTYAQNFLSGLGGPVTGNYQLTRWVNPLQQDILQATPIPSVPEPSMAAMFTLGLLGLGAAARRRKS